jgi:hypothetical protein
MRTIAMFFTLFLVIFLRENALGLKSLELLRQTGQTHNVYEHFTVALPRKNSTISPKARNRPTARPLRKQDKAADMTHAYIHTLIGIRERYLGAQDHTCLSQCVGTLIH